jgi:hypothetical protein
VLVELRDFNHSANIKRKREEGNVCKILIRTPEGKRSYGRSRHRREDNINIDLNK